MCECCLADTENIGEVIPNWMLVVARKDGGVMKKGDYGLVISNDPTFIIPANLKPLPDPAEGLSGDEINNMSYEKWEKVEKFHELVDATLPYFKCNPEIGYRLYMDAFKAGYKEEEGFIEWWLLNRIGKLIRNFEGK